MRNTLQTSNRKRVLGHRFQLLSCWKIPMSYAPSGDPYIVMNNSYSIPVQTQGLISTNTNKRQDRLKKNSLWRCKRGFGELGLGSWVKIRKSKKGRFSLQRESVQKNIRIIKVLPPHVWQPQFCNNWHSNQKTTKLNWHSNQKTLSSTHAKVCENPEIH